MAKSKKYHKIYEYIAIFEPAEEGGYTVTIPALPGCISEGDNFEEALANIKEAAELCLEVMRDGTEEIPHDNGLILVAPIKIKM